MLRGLLISLKGPILDGDECGLQNRQLLPCLQAPEAVGRFNYAGGGPAQSHAGVAPSFDVAANAPDPAVHVLDDVGTGRNV
jgi:hypothetical protein